MIHLLKGHIFQWKEKFLTQHFSTFFLQTRPNPFEYLDLAAEEHLAELMPIFEQLRAQGDLPCTYPLHVSSSAFGTAFIRGGSRSTPLSPHAPHCHPASHWVSWSIWALLVDKGRQPPPSLWTPNKTLSKPTKRWSGHEPFYLRFCSRGKISLIKHFLFPSLMAKDNSNFRLTFVSSTELMQIYRKISNSIF